MQLCAREKQPACEETLKAPRAREDTTTQNLTPHKRHSEHPQDTNDIQTRTIQTSDTKDIPGKHTHKPSDTHHKDQRMYKKVRIALPQRQYALQHLIRQEGPQEEIKHKRKKNDRETPPKSKEKTVRAG